MLEFVPQLALFVVVIVAAADNFSGKRKTAAEMKCFEPPVECGDDSYAADVVLL